MNMNTIHGLNRPALPPCMVPELQQGVRVGGRVDDKLDNII